MVGLYAVLRSVGRYAHRALAAEALRAKAEERCREAEDKLRLAECELAARSETQREILGTVEPVAGSRVRIRPIS